MIQVTVIYWKPLIAQEQSHGGIGTKNRPCVASSKQVVDGLQESELSMNHVWA